MAEKRKIKQKKEKIKEFLDTTERFVLETDSTFKKFLIQGDKEKEELFLQLFQAMDIDERISFYFDNYESIFVSLFPDDVGFFQFVPSNKSEWDTLEKNITKLNPK
jgi:hypothetical protein